MRRSWTSRTTCRPHDVLVGALELAAVYRYFPAGTIFLVVVDPGVGSARRGIAAEAGDYRFVAPDNGVLTAVLDEHPAEARRRVDGAASTHGRPSAARSRDATGSRRRRPGWPRASTWPRSAGRPARSSASTSRSRTSAADRIDGEVLRVDRFGNLITNIDRKTFDKLAAGPLDIRAGSHPVTRVVSTYADASPEEVCALFGSTDHPRDGRQRHQRRRAPRSRSRRACARRPPCVIRFPLRGRSRRAVAVQGTMHSRLAFPPAHCPPALRPRLISVCPRNTTCSSSRSANGVPAR